MPLTVRMRVCMERLLATMLRSIDCVTRIVHGVLISHVTRPLREALFPDTNGTPNHGAGHKQERQRTGRACCSGRSQTAGLLSGRA
jgi:hypothetical protein